MDDDPADAREGERPDNGVATGRADGPAADGGLGSTAWRINPPDGLQDAFVVVEMTPSQIVLTSGSGWCITADPVSGSEVERTFTKWRIQSPLMPQTVPIPIG